MMKKMIQRLTEKDRRKRKGRRVRTRTLQRRIRRGRRNLGMNQCLIYTRLLAVAQP